jgi:hypothetical protein
MEANVVPWQGIPIIVGFAVVVLILFFWLVSVVSRRRR